MEKQRRNDIYSELRNFFDMQGGVPEEWEAEIEGIYPDDAFDGLDIMVGHMCAEWGTGDARGCLSMIGAKSDEIEKLIEDNMDFCF